MSTFMIYPVYHREGYGFQVDNTEGTDGVPICYVLYEEHDDGGEGYEVIQFGVTMLDEIQTIADYLNAREDDEE